MARAMLRAICFFGLPDLLRCTREPLVVLMGKLWSGNMRTFYVRNSEDNQRLRIYLFLFAEYDGEAEDGWSRYRCAPEHAKAFEEYTRRQQVRWG